MRYVPTIGLEIHSQLATATKIFCGCSTGFGAEPNTHSDPVCLGMPGVLPVLNRKAVELALRMALYTGGEIQHRSYFARKNYFYPDLPKGYQISMFEHPLIRGGQVEVETVRGRKRIRLNRIHLEEDAGKLIHVEGRPESRFDVNRCGVPLIEIVTEPDFETVEEVTQFLEKLKEMLVFGGVSRGNMEEGNIRVDANISIRPEHETKLGTRTEIKNMNSFVNVVSAIRYEIDRQIDLVERGGRVVQETLLYDPIRDSVSSMRSKEEAHDYRYFPEPDLAPVFVDEEWIGHIRAVLPELRTAMRERFEREYGIPPYDADILTCSPAVAAWYEEVVRAGADPKKASNWVMGEVLRILNETQTDIGEFKIKPPMLASLLMLVDTGVISGSMAKTVFEEMIASGKDPNVIVEEKGLRQISDSGALREIARKIVGENPDAAEKFRAGKTQLMGFFVGEVMKATKGKANPKEVNTIIRELLS
ncbi:MAG: Asp-tRNA(Asn)/Glu-tRNA(Gln) amidotransferase subunit GatB [Candidatus Latescibacterota bacterium]